jgi:hypothetical protein
MLIEPLGCKQIFFTQILNDWNKKLIKENRNILLFLDNCSVHSQNLNLSNIKIEFFPPNCASVLQPLDMGIIKNIKVNYRSKLMSNLLREYRKNKKVNTDFINLCDALCILDFAWNEVSGQTIYNCFNKCGFKNGTITTNIEITEESYIQEANEGLEEIIGVHEFEAFVDIDKDLDKTSIISSEIIAEQIKQKYNINQEMEIPSEREKNEPIISIVSNSEAYEMVNNLRKYFSSKEGTEGIFQLLNKLDNQIDKFSKGSKQMLITDFINLSKSLEL